MHVQASPAITRFRAGVLGPFLLSRDGEVVDTSRWQRKVETLFKLLLTAPDRQRRRDDLVDILWPDADPDGGVGNLRMLVHRLRTSIDLPELSPVLSEGGWIALNPDCEWGLDLEVLVSTAEDPAAGIEALEQAAALYRGEPLPEDRYEDWAQPVREAALRARRTICLRLGLYRMSRAAHDEAIRWFEQALAVDPFDEEAFRHLLAVLHAAGRPAEALRRYATFEQLLRDELDVLPAPETRALVESIRSGQDGSVPPLPAAAPPAAELLGIRSDLPLTGRQQEIDIAMAAMDAVAAGTGRFVLLSGEQGVGKTRLAQEIAQWWAGAGFLIAAGRCSGQRRSIAWAPFLEAFEALLAAAPASVRAQLAPEWPLLTATLFGERDPAAAGNEIGQRQLYLALKRFLIVLAAQQPAAIVLDDLHRADDASLDLLHYLARELRAARVLLLATYSDADVSRDHPVSAAIRDMGREGLIERIALPRLGPEETAALVRGALGDAPGTEAFADYVYRRTRGLPFFIHRLLHVLGGRYRLLRPVGSGGMGWVFEAEDMATGERLAVKIVFARREAEPRMLLRFQQEAAALARLDHPGIVRIREAAADEYGGRIAMDLLPGQPLAAAVPPDGLSLPAIKDIALQVTAALSFAHEHGVLHRDIKPENIVVDDSGHATLTDFGIARILWPEGATSTLTATAGALGTSIYMSPEQVQRAREDARSDVYAMGVVLYELVTGRPPFEGDDAIAVAVKHVHEVPAPPSALRPGLPAEWDAVISRCLAKSPAERYQTAAALTRAIEPLSTPALPPPDTPSPAPAAPLPSSSTVPAAPGQSPAGRASAGSGPRAGRLTGRTWPAIAAGLALIAGTFVLGDRLGAGILSGSSGGHPGSSTTVRDIGPHGIGLGQFEGPSGIGIDPKTGNVWVSDAGNNRLQELSPTGIPMNAVGTAGKRNGQFETPEDLSVTSQGNIWVDDKNNSRVQKISPSGAEIDEQPLTRPDAVAVAVDPFNHLWIADLPQQRVDEFTWNLASIGSWRIPDVRVQHRPYPAGMAVDGHGDLYVADRANSRVLLLAPKGSVMTPILILGADPHQYTFNHPSDVALDRAGNIYVADTRNNKIVELSPQGRLLRTWGTPGDGLGQFNQPSSLAVDAHGNVYVTDYFHDRVQKFSPAGTVLWATNGRRPLRP
jgi:serine/threonine protein kinase/DNA-binding SARP family transcriptional activator/streptogramin lyase